MTNGHVIPSIRYADAPAAIRWLCTTLGFEEHLVVPGEQPGTIAHAQHRHGGGMVMLGSERADEYSALQKSPGQAGCVTQSTFVVVDGIETHYERARAAGAEVVTELTPQSYGGSLYSVRDPEGHHWFVGSYDPWA